MAGFDEAGLPGRHALVQGFDNCEEPGTFIASFQHDNSVLLPSLDPALKLLDLQDVSRFAFHHSLFEKLKEEIIKRLPLLNQDGLESLLGHVYSFIGVDILQPVILTIMQRIDQVQTVYLESLAKDAELYKKCPIDIRRQIWTQNQPLFGDAVGPLLNDYIKTKYELLQHTNNSGSHKSFFDVSPKERRQQRIVQTFVEMIGKSIELYNLLLQFLRTLFLRTKEMHYCTLRAEVLMAFHDANIREIRDIDPCHRFAWCIDACIREKFVDGKRQKELQIVLDKARAGEEEILGDIGMIACDPHCLNTVATNIIQHLLKLAKAEQLPRTSDEIVFLVRLLGLGLDSWSMISNQSFLEQPLNVDVITRFLPMLLNVMVEDMLSVTLQRLDGKPQPSYHFPASIWPLIQGNMLMLIVFWYYLVHLIHLGGKRKLLEKLLPEFSTSCRNVELKEHLLNHLVGALLQRQEDFQDTSYCILIFDQFLFQWLPQEAVLRQCLHIMTVIVNKVESSCLVSLLTSTQPSSEHSDALHDAHSKLVDYVASSKVSTPSSIEQQNSLSPVVSPLMPASMIPSL